MTEVTRRLHLQLNMIHTDAHATYADFRPVAVKPCGTRPTG